LLAALTGALIGASVQRAGLPGVLARAFHSSPSIPLQLNPPTWHNPFVLVVVGQSNVANHGLTRGRSGEGTYAFSTQGLFKLEDPLPGASGTGGSPWPYWASLEQLARPGIQVVVASIAQGSSAVVDWIGDGQHAQRLPQLQKALLQQGLKVDAVVWHQGETEAWSGADPVAYQQNLRSWIASVRSLGIRAPIYVCLTSRDGDGVINPSIRQAQASVWNRQADVYAGPDTDSLDASYRRDGVHFNGRGLEAFALLLQQAMTSRSDLQAPRWAPPGSGPASR
jgi:lysophospholipase L1-like esterase